MLQQPATHPPSQPEPIGLPAAQTKPQPEAVPTSQRPQLQTEAQRTFPALNLAMWILRAACKGPGNSGFCLLPPHAGGPC